MITVLFTQGVVQLSDWLNTNACCVIKQTHTKTPFFSIHKECVTCHVTGHAQSRTWQKQFYAWLIQDGVDKGSKVDKPRKASVTHPGSESIFVFAGKDRSFGVWGLCVNTCDKRKTNESGSGKFLSAFMDWEVKTQRDASDKEFFF